MTETGIFKNDSSTMSEIGIFQKWILQEQQKLVHILKKYEAAILKKLSTTCMLILFKNVKNCAFL